MPEACVLVKGKPRIRGIPEATPTPVPVPVPVPAPGPIAKKAGATGLGAEEAAAEMFLAKPGAAVRAPSVCTCIRGACFRQQGHAARIEWC